MTSSAKIQQNTNTLFPEMVVEKTISLESRRYIGNKTKL